MKRIIFLWCIIMPLITVCKNTSNAIDKPILTLEDHTTASEPDIVADNPLFDTFHRFIRIFLILFNTQRIHAGMKSVEEMATRLIATAFELIKSTRVSPSTTQEEIAHKILAIDPNIRRAMSRTVALRSLDTHDPLIRRPMHSPNCSCPKEVKEKEDGGNIDIVLGNFARIVQNFFNILQDPNNSENVAPNLTGMLSGIVNIGVEVIKNGNINEDATEIDIEQYVKTLNPKLKRELLSTLFETNQCAQILS